MLVDTIAEDPRWDAAQLEILAERAARATLRNLKLDPAQYEIALLGCDDIRIATLNADFRDKPQPTNVLSWPATDLGADGDGERPQEPPQGSDEDPVPLGDIAIAYDTCAREASGLGKPLGDHVTHLIVHGVLHLLGYDHIRDADATLMEATETRILGNLGLADPYGTDGGL